MSMKRIMAFCNESENFDVTLDYSQYLKNISFFRVIRGIFMYDPEKLNVLQILGVI